MKTLDYLAAVRAKLNATTDYQVAKALKVNTSLYYKYLKGKSVPGPLTAFKIAEILGDQPAAVIADLELERAEKAEREEDVDAWRGVMKRVAGAAASILLAAGMGGFPNGGADLAAAKNSTDIYIV